MTSKAIKTAVLAYYRFKRGYFVSTETNVSHGIADVLAVSKDRSISVEIEVKISKADLKNEWTNKATKHSRLQDETNQYGLVPNYFYFAMPESLYNEALNESISLNGHTSYGILIVTDDYQIQIVKQAKRLNKSKNDKLIHNLFLRATSELVNSYLLAHTPYTRLY